MSGKNCNGFASALLLVGAINWGLIGVFGFNLVDAVLPGLLERAAYVAVGWAALYKIFRNGGSTG